MASIQTNLSRSPYFDDFVENTDYYRILYKPGVAVQTRELNQTQSILQDQINKFGRNIFKEGSIVEGCALTFDSKIAYVKLNDNYVNSTSFTISDFENQYVYNSNGLKALVLNTTQGFVSQAPNTNTLYVKYLNSTTYSNGSQQSTFDANDVLTVATSANLSIGNVTVCSNTSNPAIGNPTGYGYAMTSSEGVVFKKGTFLYVPKQTILVTPYTNIPDGLSVGFDAVESIITSQANSSLYDNAAGSPNYSAPGADRLQIVPELVVRNTSEVANNNSFFTIADFKEGNPVTVKQTAQYSSLGAAMAQRTYETNGDFVVSPFLLTTEPLANTSDPNYYNYVNLIASKGLGYVEGYRVEYLNNNIVPLRKGTDYNFYAQQIVSANFGNYVFAKEFVGEFGDSSAVIQVELHNVAKQAVTAGTLLATGYSATTKIGTANIRGFSFDSGIPGTPSAQYRLYLFNVQMLPGHNFGEVKSVIYYDGGLEGVCDVVLDYSSKAVMQQPALNGLIYRFGQKAIKSDGFDNTEFVYRKKSTAQFLANGYCSVTIPPVAGAGTEQFPYSGTLSATQQQEFFLVPTSSGITANSSGKVSVNTTSNAVIGSSTAFLANYVVGDFVGVYTTGSYENRMITFIANNTYMNVSKPFNNANTNADYAKTFPVGAPLAFSNRNNRNIVVSTSTAEFQLGDTPLSPFNVDVFYSVNRASTVPIKKVLNSGKYVKIKVSNNAAGLSGPWSLGLPDVVSIDGVWVGSGSSYTDSGANMAQYFKLDNGQRDSHYDLASISVLTNSPADHLTSNSNLLVKLTHWTYNQSQGYGFFTANSYPIDDIDQANTNAITTQEIPLYTSSTGSLYNLRDSVDFRPFAVNTATSTSTIASATVNPSSTLTFSGNPYLPAPDSNFQSDLEYYLRRIDRVSLDIGGNLIVSEGIAAPTNPTVPQEKLGAMTLGFMYVPPFPSLPTSLAKQYNRYDYAITSRLAQNQRYTMKDIGALRKRIENLEYYTSLSLLEQSAASLQVRSSSTGQNRFQNGFFVDAFKGFNLTNTFDPQFYIAIDDQRNELRPAFVQFRSQFTFDAVRSSGVTQHGELIMLNHTSNNVYSSQNFASKYRNCIEGNVYDWAGTIVLDPPGTISPDITTSPPVINNIDMAQNWINLSNAWGTKWGNWVQVSNNTVTTTNPGVDHDHDNDRDDQGGSTTTTTTTVSQRVGQQLNVQTQTDSYNLGTFVTGVSILPYLKAAIIRYTAHGLKPNTRLYAYFANVPVSQYCAPANASLVQTGNFGDPITSDATGSAYGYFYLPPNTFKSQENTFVLNDISDLTQGASATQTQASAVFYGSTLSISMGQSILSTREAIATEQFVTQSNVVITSVTTPIPTSGHGSCGCGCFTFDTLVSMADGSFKKISEVDIGDYVLNKDGKVWNKVLFIEKVKGDYFEKLYSPSDEYEPFATANHPMFIDGEMASVDPDKNNQWYPWLGKNKVLVPHSVVDATSDIVYNLWVDGDNTYIVNGYGTHSIIGDGGLLRNAIEQGYVSYENGLETMRYYTEAGKAITYGVYVVNNLLGKANIKFINKLAAKILTKDTVARNIADVGFKIIGGIACLFKK